MTISVAGKPHKYSVKSKLELALQQVSDRSTRQLLKEVISDLQKPLDFSWMKDEYRLSPAEFRVLSLIFQGKGRKEIALEIGVSPTTVGTQTQSIYKKCRVSRTSELMSLALNHPRI